MSSTTASENIRSGLLLNRISMKNQLKAMMARESGLLCLPAQAQTSIGRLTSENTSLTALKISISKCQWSK
jgi:hypothetical protein